MERQIIKGNTRIAALIGDPVSHSLSPLIHNHIFASLGINCVYIPLRVPRGSLHWVLPLLRGAGFVGANVTIPHKQAILPFCDCLSKLSELSGTVNTLYQHDGLVHATTTDAQGFSKAVEAAGFPESLGRTTILGSGGVARTLAFHCALTPGTASLVILGRDESKAARLCDEVREKTGYPVLSAGLVSARAASLLADSTLVVNCTPVGMAGMEKLSPLQPEQLHPGLAVFDTIYNPKETALLHLAKKRGCRTANGLAMLYYQALESLRIWTGQEIPPSILPLGELEQELDMGN